MTKKKIERVKILIAKEKKDQDLGFWLTDLYPEKTGLPFLTLAYCIDYGSTIKEKDGIYRIKFQKNIKYNTHGIIPINYKNFITVSIENNPIVIDGKLNNKEFELIKKFIKMNKKILIEHWKNILFSSEISKQIKSI